MPREQPEPLGLATARVLRASRLVYLQTVCQELKNLSDILVIPVESCAFASVSGS